MFRYDPIKPLIESGNRAIEFFTRRDILCEDAGEPGALRGLPEVQKIFKKQQPDGAFAKGERKEKLIETWRQLRFLVQMFELDRTHPAVGEAAEFIFSCQAGEGDIRGILGSQYAPYYTGAILFLLIKAGYAQDKRTQMGMEWLLKMRQDDGGWVIGSPGMVKRTWKEQLWLTSGWREEPERDFDFSLPFSAAGTGMAIRAFAAHPKYRGRPETLKAALLLKSKFFKKDNWTYLGTPDHWVRFNFPYWWNDALSALDIVSLIGIPKEDEDVKKALEWFKNSQQPDGLWKASYSNRHKEAEDKGNGLREWITLSVLRVFRRYYPEAKF
jgi:hypothetical protein